MELKDFLAIAGKPGLYKNIAQAKSGFIVESLLDGKRSQVFTTDKVNSLSEISIFTNDEDKPLADIFRQMKEHETENPVPDGKIEDQKLKKYFEAVVPEYDRERVYISHMRKILNWYNLLSSKDLIDLIKEAPAEEATTTAETTDSES